MEGPGSSVEQIAVDKVLDRERQL
jgi:hypothetical protein